MNETGEPKIIEFIFPETLQIINSEPKPLFYDNSGDLAAIEFCSSPADDAVSRVLFWFVIALLAGLFCWGVSSNFSEGDETLDPVKTEVKQ
jgi:hypothetical protein